MVFISWIYEKKHATTAPRCALVRASLSSSLHASSTNPVKLLSSSPDISLHTDSLSIQLDWTPSRNTRKINCRMNQKGYDNSETTVGKLSARRIQICFDYFCKIHFWSLFLNDFSNIVQKNSQSRIGFASSNTLVQRSQARLRCLGLVCPAIDF